MMTPETKYSTTFAGIGQMGNVSIHCLLSLVRQMKETTRLEEYLLWTATPSTESRGIAGAAIERKLMKTECNLCRALVTVSERPASPNPLCWLALLTTICVALLATSAQAQFLWAKRVASTTAGPSTDLAIGMALDTNANCYVTGWFDGMSDFGGVILTNKSSGGTDIFVAKYNSAAALQWAHRAGGSTGGNSAYLTGGRGVGVDTNGNVYVAGGFYGPADFGNITLPGSAAGYEECFLAKYDNTGAIQWARQSGGGTGVQAEGLAVDGAGNCYLVGYANNGTPITFGTTNVFDSNSTGYDIFLVKYDNTGAIQWAQLMRSPVQSWAAKVAVDAVGNVYVRGCFTTSITIGTSNLVSAISGKNFFIAKFNNSGAMIWVQQPGGGQVAQGGVAIDQSGDVYTSGDFKNSLNFGSILLENTGSTFDAFVAKYNTTGALQWARQTVSTNIDDYYDVALDSQGNVYGAGCLNSRAAVAKYDPAGSVQWIASASAALLSPFSSGVAKCAVDLDGNCYLAGWYQGSTTFGTNVLQPQNNWNYFLAKIQQQQSTVTITVQTNPSNGGTVSGGGIYAIGTNVQITATVSNDWSFTGWSDGTTNNPHTITVPSTNLTYTAYFTACTYALAVASTNVLSGAGNGSFGLTTLARCAWTAYSNTNWVHTTSSGTGNGMVDYTFDANLTGIARSGSIMVNGQEFTVNQAAATCTFTWTAVSTNTAASASSGSVGLTTLVGCTWTATSNTNWLHTSSNGTGSGTVSYTVDDNTTNCSGRSGTLTVGGQMFTVTQATGAGSYVLATTSTNVAASVGSGSVGVTAGVDCVWTATSNIGWLTITGGGSGIGNGMVSYTIADNSGNCTNRIGTLTIAGQIFTVTQATGSGSYMVAVASTNVSGSSDSGSVTVTAGVGCAWSASSNTNWLHTTSSGNGNGTVYYTVDANTSASARTGTITVQGQTFTITQAASTLVTISVQANPANGGTVSGDGTYNVGSSHQISATANSGWTFAGWSDGGSQTHSITVPATNITYTATFTNTVSNSPPVFITAPIITNSLLAVNEHFVVVAGETNIFNVVATDPEGGPLTYQWIYGDGGSSTWSTVALASHVYAVSNCGSYIASVTVSDGHLTATSNLAVMAACDFISITKLQVGLNFAKPNVDTISLTAKLGLPGITTVSQLNSVRIVVDVGGAQVSFTLDKKGHGVGANGTCVLGYTKPIKKVPMGYWTATITLSKGNWHAQWLYYGLDNATHKGPGVSVTLPVVVMIGNEAFAAEPTLHYIVTANKTGTAK